MYPATGSVHPRCNTALRQTLIRAHGQAVRTDDGRWTYVSLLLLGSLATRTYSITFTRKRLYRFDAYTRPPGLCHVHARTYDTHTRTHTGEESSRVQNSLIASKFLAYPITTSVSTSSVPASPEATKCQSAYHSHLRRRRVAHALRL